MEAVVPSDRPQSGTTISAAPAAQTASGWLWLAGLTCVIAIVSAAYGTTLLMTTPDELLHTTPDQTTLTLRAIAYFGLATATAALTACFILLGRMAPRFVPNPTD